MCEKRGYKFNIDLFRPQFKIQNNKLFISLIKINLYNIFVIFFKKNFLVSV